MQLFIVATALFGIAAAAYAPYPEQSNRPQASLERTARILSLDSDVKEDSYRYNFETENGIKAEEQGQEGGAGGIESQGSFQYTGDDGQIYAVSYNSGTGGFQPVGAHFPTPPPTPEAILKALEQNARDEAAGIIDDGSYSPGKYGDAAGAAPFAQPNYARAQASAGFRQPYKF